MVNMFRKIITMSNKTIINMPRKIIDEVSRKVMANILRSCTLHLDIMKRFLPIDAQRNDLKE